MPLEKVLRGCVWVAWICLGDVGFWWEMFIHFWWRKSEVKVAQSCPTLCNPMDCGLPGSSVHGILQARILEWVAVPFSGDFPNPGIEPRSPALQADSLPAEPPGKPKNIGVGSLSLLEGIFPTQELTQALLHCRRILYQLSHQGSPDLNSWVSPKSFHTWSLL